MNNLSKFHFRLHQRILRYLGIGIFIVVIILGAIFGVEYVQKSSVIKNVISLATTRKPEAFTELYFENHIDLPTENIANTSYNFSFSVHNLEHKEMVYPYEVYISSGSARRTIANGTFTLAQNAYKNVVITYSFPQKVQREKVVVSLTNKNQQIDFFVNNKE